MPKIRNKYLFCGIQREIFMEALTRIKDQHLPENQITIISMIEQILRERYKTPRNIKSRQVAMNMTPENLRERIDYHYLYQKNKSIEKNQKGRKL